MEYIHEYVPACLYLSPILLCLSLNDRLLTGWARGFAFVPLSLSPWKLHQRKETAHPPSLQGQKGKSRVLHHPAGSRSWIRPSATPHSQKATELKGKWLFLLNVGVYLEFIAKDINRKTSLAKDLAGFVPSAVTTTHREAHINIQIWMSFTAYSQIIKGHNVKHSEDKVVLKVKT